MNAPTSLAILIVLVLGGCSGPAGSQSVPPGAPVAAASAAAASPRTTSGPSRTPTMRPTSTPIPKVLDREPWLAFQAQTGAGYGIHLARPDGTGLHRWPAPVPGTHEHPDWSPDGSQILLNTVMPDGTEDVWVGGVDGSGTRLLYDCVAPCVWADEPAWSPDGSQVAFQRLVQEAEGRVISTLELLDVASGATSVVATMPRQEIVLQPRWSPDGRRIVVEVIHLDGTGIDADIDAGSIGIIDLDDAEAGVRSIAGDLANSPDWSADGSLVLWSRPAADEGSDVWVAAPDGSGARRVTDMAATGARADQPAFTPDGRAILFVWYRPDDGAELIGRIGVDGSDLRSATGDLVIAGTHPHLRPVGGSGG